MRSTAGNRTPVVISGFLLRLPVRSHSAFGQASVSSAPMAAVWTSGNVFRSGRSWAWRQIAGSGRMRPFWSPRDNMSAGRRSLYPAFQSSNPIALSKSSSGVECRSAGKCQSPHISHPDGAARPGSGSVGHSTAPLWVTAPLLAWPTTEAYFSSRPPRGGAAPTALSRALSSALVNATSRMVPAPGDASISMMSPSRTRAIGPPARASGQA